MENGRVANEAMKKELITEDGLAKAASRQGFGSLDDLQRATLNPDGSFAFVKKHKESGGNEHHEILSRIDHSSEIVGRLHPSESFPGN